MASPLRLRDTLQSQSRATRELLIFVAALGLGLFMIPPLIWLAGTLTLGPYESGGVGALFKDFFQGLASITPSFWVVALGPYLLILVARGLYSLVFPRKTGETNEATRPDVQRGQNPRRQVRTADTAQPFEQAARRPATQRRAEPLLGEDLAPEPVVEEAPETDPAPEPPPVPRMAPQVRQPAPRPAAAPAPQLRQVPQMRDIPPAQPREAPLPQMRATPPARETPAQVRQPPVQPREAPASMWPANPAPPREAPSQPRQVPAQTRQPSPQRREPPRATPAPARTANESAPGGNDVKSTNNSGKKRIPPTIGDL